MTLTRTAFVAGAFAAAAALFPGVADARGGYGGGGAGGGSWHSGGGGWHGGGAWHGGGHRHHGYWGGYRGYWPGAFWGGVGIGVGFGAIGYYGGYYGGYYPYPAYAGYYPAYVGPTWGTAYYDAPLTTAPVYGGAEPARSGQPVPPATRAADPIFYPRNGQSADTVEHDRRECNRWATTQPGAMADASIFQRATYACMEGRGYTVR